MPRLPRRARRGFTLMELLISVTLMMIAIGIAIPFFLIQGRALDAQSGRLDAQLNVNFALDAIDRDLRVAGVGITMRQPLLVQAASNEIPAARHLLSKMDLAQKTTLADALHTQTETVQQILFEGGGDYVLTVKNNQKALVKTLATLLTRRAFSPSAHRADPRADAGTQSGATGDSAPGVHGRHPRASGLSRRAPDRPAPATGAASRPENNRDGVSDQQSDLGPTRCAGLAHAQTRVLGD